MPKIKMSLLKGVAHVRRSAQKAGLRKLAPIFGGRTLSGHKQTASQKAQVSKYKAKEWKKTKRNLRRAWRRLI